MRWTAVLIVMLVGPVGCGGVPQSQACADFVACQRARDAEQGITTDMVRYEPSGACWENPSIGSLCDRSCTNGLDWVREAYDGLPAACDP